MDTFGIALVVSGLSFTINIIFRPRHLKQVTYGKLIFISTETHKHFYCQFSVPIKCIPCVEEIFITPVRIEFRQTPFWEVKNMNPKCLRVYNLIQNLNLKLNIFKMLDY